MFAWILVKLAAFCMNNYENVEKILRITSEFKKNLERIIGNLKHSRPNLNAYYPVMLNHTRVHTHRDMCTHIHTYTYTHILTDRHTYTNTYMYTSMCTRSLGAFTRCSLASYCN